MVKIHSVLVILAAFLLLAHATTTPEVIDLTDQNFLDSIAESGDASWLVEFFAPWCGHCKKLAPTWESLAKSLHERTDAEYRVAKVDCTVNKAVSSAFKIAGFPTIKLIKKGHSYDYRGERSVEAFTNFATSPQQGEGTPLPGKIESSPVKPVEDSNDHGDHHAVQFEIPDAEKLFGETLKLVKEHPAGTAVVVLVATLMGLLVSLTLCFPNPNVIWHRESDEIKEKSD